MQRADDTGRAQINGFSQRRPQRRAKSVSLVASGWRGFMRRYWCEKPEGEGSVGGVLVDEA